MGAGFTDLLTMHCVHWVHISTSWIVRVWIIREDICIYSVLPRNILRHVEVHATLSVHIIRGGCKKAQGNQVAVGTW